MKPLRLFRSGMIAIPLAWAVLLSPVFTASASAASSVEERLAELEQEIKILKRQRELEVEINTKKEKETPVLVAGDKGFALQSKDKNFEFKLRGYVQADSRYFIEDDSVGQSNTYLLRRVRPQFEGTFYRYVGFRIMPDFAGSATSLQDAYVDFKYWKSASLRVGKFKSPFGLERLQSGTNLLFVERGLPTNLVPNRDLGVQLFGELFDGRLEYQVGAFNGVEDGASGITDAADDKDFVARIFANPFMNSGDEWISGLGLGVAASWGKAHGTAAASGLPTYRSTGQASAYSYIAGGPFADGDRFRVSPQAYYSWGSFGLLGEYVLSSQDTRRSAIKDNLQAHAWQLATSYALTGEKASYKGLKPKNSFDPAKGTWGAFEIAARLGSLSVDDAAFGLFVNPQTSSNEITSWGLGLNWYLNQNLKFQTSFDQTYFDGTQLALRKDRETENALFSRVQVAF